MGFQHLTPAERRAVAQKGGHMAVAMHGGEAMTRKARQAANARFKNEHERSAYMAGLRYQQLRNRRRTKA